MRLNDLRDNPGATKARKRVGRGIGSGKGKTAGRGIKGQKSRSGVAIKGFEGGQMPIHRRLPKRGFKNIFSKDFNEVNLGRVQQAIDHNKLDAKAPVTVDALLAAGIIRRIKDGVRLLGQGDIKSKVTFEVTGASAGAVKSVEAAGGSVTITPLTKKEAKSPDGEEKSGRSKKSGATAQPKKTGATVKSGAKTKTVKTKSDKAKSDKPDADSGKEGES